jgi:glycosyltransferase involved in cell wall biosynthesis
LAESKEIMTNSGATEAMPMVSAVIPCYNQAQFLAAAIESVLAQTYPRIELFVVDDGSSDHTAEVARQFAAVHYLRQENRGVSAARNAGLKASCGDYIVFLDADDRLLPDAISAHLQCFAAHPEAGFVVGDIDQIDEDGTYVDSPRWPLLYGDCYEQLLKVNHVANTIAVMFKRSVFERAGAFDESHAAGEDYELLLRVARHFPTAHHRTLVAQYRRYHTSMSRRGLVMLLGMRRVTRAQLPFVKGNRQLQKAYRKGQRYWREQYGAAAARQVQRCLRRGQILRAGQVAAGLLWYVRERIPVVAWKRRARLIDFISSQRRQIDER